MMIGLQAANYQPTDGKDECGEEIEAHQLRDQLLLGWVKPRRNSQLRLHQRQRKHRHQHCQNSRNHKSKVGHHAEHLPARGTAVLVKIFAQHGNGATTQNRKS